MTQSNNGNVAVELEDKYLGTQVAVISPVTNSASVMLGGDLSLAGGPRLGRDQNTGSGSRIDGEQRVEIGPRPGGDSLGGVSRSERDHIPGRGPRLDGDHSLGGDPRPGRDPERGLRQEQHQSSRVGASRVGDQNLVRDLGWVEMKSWEEVPIQVNIYTVNV